MLQYLLHASLIRCSCLKERLAYAFEPSDQNESLPRHLGRVASLPSFDYSLRLEFLEQAVEVEATSQSETHLQAQAEVGH